MKQDSAWAKVECGLSWENFGMMGWLLNLNFSKFHRQLKVLHELHKPIWITEFDKSAISPTVGPSAYSEQQAAALTVALNEIASRADEYDVIGADIYELLDQPELATNPSVKPCQAEFGILTSRGEFTAASRAVQNFPANH